MFYKQDRTPIMARNRTTRGICSRIGSYPNVVWFSVFIVFTTGRPGTADTVEDALDCWDSAVENIWSYDVLLDVTTVTRSDKTTTLETVATCSLRHRYLRGMWRIDFVEMTPAEGVPLASFNAENKDDVVVAIAWDGKDGRTFAPQGNIGTIMGFRDVNAAMTHGPHYHQLFGFAPLGQAYVDAIRPRRGIRIDSQSAQTLVLEVPPAATGARVSYRTNRLKVVLAPDKGYMPTSIWVSERKDLDAPMHEIENTLGLISEFWLPVRSVHRVYRRAGPSEKPEVFSENRIEVDAEQSAMNIDIDPDLFRVQFSEGTIVFDKGMQRNFLAKADGGRDYEGFDQLMNEMVRKRREAKLASSYGDRQRRLLSAGVAVLLVVICSFIVFAKRGKRVARKQDG